MNWSLGRDNLKLIYVVGNETARQGPLDFDYAITSPRAIRNGIIVNGVYCGEVDYQSATPTWKQMTQLANGRYLEIAASGGALRITTPYDAELERLSASINQTYLAYGARGSYGAANQLAQDANARAVGGAHAAASRGVSKSSAQYNNRNWDLVDASREPNFDWSKVKEEDFPIAMRRMTPTERKAHVNIKAAERAAIQAQIRELAQRRQSFIDEETKKRGLSGDKALDEALRRSIIEQAQQKGFHFDA